MIDLKPCPHCGGRVRFNHNAELVPDGIFCPNCHMLVRFTAIQADRKDKFEVVMDRIAGAWNKGRRMKQWQYDEDTGSVMCRCPDCGGRLRIGLYLYNNPYNFCPYCGIKLAEGEITKKRKQVYGTEK